MDPHRRDVAGLTCAEWTPAGEPGRRILPRMTVERADANHLTLLFDPRIAAAVASV